MSILVWTGLSADMGTGGCIGVEMTTSLMALAVGGTDIDGITVKKSVATASSSAIETSNSNNPQQ
jgi:hypothetical protein